MEGPYEYIFVDDPWSSPTKRRRRAPGNVILCPAVRNNQVLCHLLKFLGGPWDVLVGQVGDEQAECPVYVICTMSIFTTPSTCESFNINQQFICLPSTVLPLSTQSKTFSHDGGRWPANQHQGKISYSPWIWNTLTFAVPFKLQCTFFLLFETKFKQTRKSPRTMWEAENQEIAT